MSLAFISFLIAAEWGWNPDTVTSIGTVLVFVATSLVGIFAIRPAVEAARSAAKTASLEANPILVFEGPTQAEAIADAKAGTQLFRLDLQTNDGGTLGLHNQSGILPNEHALVSAHYFRLRNVGRSPAVDVRLDVGVIVDGTQAGRNSGFSSIPASGMC